MILYAIKDIRLGYYIPMSSMKKGFTHIEPIKDCIPRLFKTQRAAQCALNWWLQGKVTTVYTVEESRIYTDPYTKVTPVPHRSRGDMRVVKIIVQEDKSV